MYKLHQSVRGRSALYTRFTSPRSVTAVHQAVENNLVRTVFLYTSCMDLYVSPKSDQNSAFRLFVYNMYQTGRSRRTLYNRCTTPRSLTDAHQAMVKHLQRKSFSYTSCKDLYSSPKSERNSTHRLRVYNLCKTGRSRRTLYTRFTTLRPLTDVYQAMENNLQ